MMVVMGGWLLGAISYGSGGDYMGASYQTMVMGVHCSYKQSWMMVVMSVWM